MATTGLLAPKGQADRHASWLELFYDLLYVALFAELAHALAEDLGAGAALKALILFVPAWWAWVANTFSTNVFGEGGTAHRLTMLAHMVCLLLMAGGIGAALHGDIGLYAAGYAASRFVRLGFMVLPYRREHGTLPPLVTYGDYLASAVLWSLSIVVGTPGAYLLWALALGIELAVRLREQATAPRVDDQPRFDAAHLVERFGLFVILALGEGVVQIAAALAGTERSATVVATAVVAFGILAGLWWFYFDFASESIGAAFEAHPDREFALGRDVFVFGHFGLVGAIVALSAGFGQVIAAAATGAAFTDGLALIGDGLAVFLVTSAVIAVHSLGASPARTAAGLVPALVALALLGNFGDRLEPLVALTGIFLVVAATAWYEAHQPDARRLVVAAPD
jgi:low temperature requirement protein LtrA